MTARLQIGPPRRVETADANERRAKAGFTPGSTGMNGHVERPLIRLRLVKRAFWERATGSQTIFSINVTHTPNGSSRGRHRPNKIRRGLGPLVEREKIRANYSENCITISLLFFFLFLLSLLLFVGIIIILFVNNIIY